MALYGFTADTDFVGKGKTLSFISLSQGVGAQTVRFLSGGSGGTEQFQIQVPAATSVQVVLGARPLVFPGGLYIDVVGTGFTQGCVDLA